MYEELFEEQELAERTVHAKINRASGAPVPVGELDQWLEMLQANLPRCEEDELLQDLKRLVPSFQPAVPQRVS